MTKLELNLQLAVGLMVMTGTFLLGIAQSNYVLPTLMTISVVLSTVVTDRLGWFRLHRSLANVAMIVTAILSLLDFFGSDSVAQLEAIARLLVYVQMVMLFQEKNYRIYGHLAIFSLLQVVVASLLNVGFIFGLLLVVYLFTSLIALIYFAFHRDRVQINHRNRLRKRIALHYEQSSQDEASSLWRTALGGRSKLVAELPNDMSEYRLSWLPHVLGIGIGTVAFALCFFYAMPRTREGGWHKNLNKTTGFSRSVSFDHMGEILQSNELVMEVTLRNPETDEPIYVTDEPYFRGATLTTYRNDGGSASWEKPQVNPFGVAKLLKRPPKVRLCEQRISLNLINDRRTLFAVVPAYQVTDTPSDTYLDINSMALVRERWDKKKSGSKYEFTVLTTAFEGGRQMGIVPFLIPWNKQPQLDKIRNRWLEVPDAIRATLAEEADQVLRTTPPFRGPMARALAHYLRDRTEFTYSLRLDRVKRDPSIDPVVDFLTNHRTGHCEYFASALVLMLRAKGIPARLVAGYKGGDLNEITGEYRVRQKHAHTWVEVFLEKENLSPDLKEKYKWRLAGGWLQLDPTPPSDTAFDSALADNPIVNRVSDSFDYAESMWEEYVVGLTPERQQQLYSPLGQSGAVDDWLSANSENDGDAKSSADLQQYEWIIMRGLKTAATIAGIVLIVTIAVRFALRRRRGSSSSQQTGVAVQPEVEFFKRLTEILERYGIVRNPVDTPLEWSVSLDEKLSGTELSSSSFTQDLVWIFYRVRFGERDLDNDEAQWIEHALDQLDTALANLEERSAPAH